MARLRAFAVFSPGRWLVVFAAFSLASAWPVRSEAGREIPVYPGAQLITEQEPGEEPVCCTFTTRDPYAKVLAFYETRLKQKALDTKALAARYPDMRPQLEQMTKQMPPNARAWFFVIEEMAFSGKKFAQLFGVLSGPAGVNFSVSEEELGASGAKFARAWHERTGRLSPDELAEKQRAEADQQAAREEAEGAKQAEEEARQEQKRSAAQQAARAKRVLAALEKELPRNDVRLYPAARQGIFLEACGEVGACNREFRYASSDDFQKVYDFYAAQLAAVPFPQVNEKGEAAMVTQLNKNGEKERLAGSDREFHAWRFAQLRSKKCRAEVVIRELSETRGGPKRVYLWFDFAAIDIPKGCAGFTQTAKELER